MKKKLLSILMAALLCVMPFSTVLASSVSNITLPTISPSLPNGTGDIGGIVGMVLGIISFIAYAVAIIMVMYVGVKYLTAGAGTKAEVKSTLVPMLIGAVLVALAPTLVNWIFGALGFGAGGNG